MLCCGALALIAGFAAWRRLRAVPRAAVALAAALLAAGPVAALTTDTASGTFIARAAPWAPAMRLLCGRFGDPSPSLETTKGVRQ